MARLKPLPRKERLLQVQPVQNRGRELRRDKDDVKNIEVGLLDVDAAIMYYFENVILLLTNCLIIDKPKPTANKKVL